MLSDPVGAIALVRDHEAVLLPGPVEQGNDPVLVDLEEALERPVARPLPFGHKLRVLVRQHSLRADQSHEVHTQARWLFARQFEALDLARGEGDGWAGGEMCDLARRIAELT